LIHILALGRKKTALPKSVNKLAFTSKHPLRLHVKQNPINPIKVYLFLFIKKKIPFCPVFPIHCYWYFLSCRMGDFDSL
jgi:hypothetical protein